MCSVTFYFSENRVGYEKMWTSMVGRQATDDSIIGRMRIACWTAKATSTHWEDVILIAFPRQHWLREGALMWSYTYIACLVWRDVKTELTLQAAHVTSLMIRSRVLPCVVLWMCVFVYLCFYDLCSEVFSVERCVWGVRWWMNWKGRERNRSVLVRGCSTFREIARSDRLHQEYVWVLVQMGGGSYVNCQSRVQCCQLRRRLEKRETLHIHLFHLSWRIILN